MSSEKLSTGFERRRKYYISVLIDEFNEVKRILDYMRGFSSGVEFEKASEDQKNSFGIGFEELRSRQSELQKEICAEMFSENIPF
ncbi:hypothetical protein [Agarilytica rhodophyticola]|uniref:hypothetical protein n=1 Tax=Agarilytica rhodophyticola TaxID=1737490 RepID=UPI000B343573|nr:hypothetical protein [Agarilytica rhodophyticola]